MFCSAPLGSCRTAGTLIQYSVTCSSPSTSPTLLLLNMNYIFILHKRTYYYWSLSCLSLVFLILDTLAVFLLYLDTDHAQLRFLWHHIDENQHCLPPSLIAPPILFFPALSSYISWICPMMHCSLPADGCRWKSSENLQWEEERWGGEGGEDESLLWCELELLSFCKQLSLHINPSLIYPTDSVHPQQMCIFTQFVSFMML